jgi:uncharacterized secreted protein with C-terminal beta-propeller domain
MTDDELDRELRAARPHTAADDGWAASEDGERALAGVRRAAGNTSSDLRTFRLRRARPLALGVGFAAAVAAAVAVGLMSSGPARQVTPPVALPSGQDTRVGPAPVTMALVAYTNCDAMLDGLRAHTAANIGPYGLSGAPGRFGYATGLKGDVRAPTAPGTAYGGVAEDQAAPDHSTTNVQEIGVGEPDIVETDGRRVVSVSDGVLRVVDAATHRITGRLDLGIYAGAESAQLLMSGDRLLVILGNQVSYYGGGIAYDYAYPQVATGGSTFLLIDLAAQPTIVSTMHSNGGYVDARMIGGTVRLVVQSTPKLSFPVLPGNKSDRQRTAHNRDVVRHAPLSAWLPTFDVTTGGSTTTKTVPCERVSHPAHYTGESMLTVYTLDLAGDLADPDPVSLAADGTTVYATTSSLYVASTQFPKYNVRVCCVVANGKTQLHRFDITGTSRPHYLGSGTVPGQLLNSYSMSEFDGSLRVVTTSNLYAARSSTAVYVLDADTLRLRGHVGGLGRGEQMHAVRFIGALGYVVTFESVDPLYVLDLHDPAHPRKAGELTITGYSDYLHPVSDGRLLGVGQNVNSSGIVTGLQVSLFDVDSPGHPKRLDRVTRKHSPSETPIDPHAFLYWPASKLAVVPIDSWNPNQSGAAVVLHVGTDNISVIGTIRNPAVTTADSYDTGIERTLVIGDDIWTMSSSGLKVSDLHSLDRQAWIGFQ